MLNFSRFIGALLLSLTFFSSNTYAQCANTNSINTFPAVEDFESQAECEMFCNPMCALDGTWLNEDGDTFDWTTETNFTSSGVTGPNGDFLPGGGTYMYLETSCPTTGGRTAMMQSPGYDVSSLTNPIFSLAYHMFGSTIGTLEVQVSDDDCATWNTEFSISGQQQTSSNEPYIVENVDLSAYSTSTDLHIRIVGTTGSSFTGDIAIDALTVASGDPELDIFGNSVAIPSGSTATDVTNNTDFGVYTGGDPIRRSFSLTNVGVGTAINLTGTELVEISGPGAADFSLVAQPASTIVALSTETIEIDFMRPDSGTSTATVTISSNDADENPYTFTISGTGSFPEIEITGNDQEILSGATTASELDNTDFGIIDLDAEAVTRSFVINNTGNRDLVLSGLPIVEISGDNAANFSVSLDPTTPIEADGQSQFEISLNPVTEGVQSAVVTIANDDADESPYTFTVQANVDSDLDGDGLSRAEEEALGTDPNNPDSDGDGLNDSEEVEAGTDPNNPDSDGDGLGDSQEVAGGTNPNNSDSDGDGLGDSQEVAGGTDPNNSDSDGDGLGDSQEVAAGTDANNPDSDGDGVDDSQEVAENSDPLDDSSQVFNLSNMFCAEWNGFLGQQFNIAEFTNVASTTRQVSVGLFDPSGNMQGSQTENVLPGAQTDILVHDITGWSLDSAGTVCATVTDPSSVELAEATSMELMEGDIDGRILHYHPDGLGGFDYVVAMPFENALTGPVFAQYNTFHPSLDPAELGNFVANWFTVANAEETPQNGNVIVYDSAGTVISDATHTLVAGARLDVGVHEFGANQVGVVEWRPEDDTAGFRVRLNRYVYSGLFPSSSVSEAVSFSASRGSRQSLIAPVDTRGLTAVVELTNPSENAADADVVVTDSAGNSMFDTTITLPAYATQHLVLDGDLVSQLGQASIQAQTGGEVIATVLQYGRTATAGVNNIYSVGSRESLGESLNGSYNTFLGQGCSLLVANANSVEENITINATRFDSTAVITDQAEVVPANGVFEFDLCAVEGPNVFGQVEVTPANPNSVLATVVRTGLDSNYVIATPAR